MWNNPKQLNFVANVIYFIAFLLLLLALAQWIIFRSMFVLKGVVLEGDTQHLSVPIVNANISNRIEGNFFTVDLQQVKDLFEQIPWVRQVSVRRFWPNHLIVNVDDFKPLGIWNDSQLVSRQGEVFTVNQGEIDSTLPKFEGSMQSSVEMVGKYQDLSQWIAPLGLTIESLFLSDSHTWSMTLSNGTFVELGSEVTQETLFDRVRRLVVAWPAVTQRWGNQIESVDLRYPNGFAVRASGVRFLPNSDR